MYKQTLKANAKPSVLTETLQLLQENTRASKSMEQGVECGGTVFGQHREAASTETPAETS